MSTRHDERDNDRLNAFSDGIFAFAATLLVLQIVVPEPSQTPNLRNYLTGQHFISEIVTFVLSFLVVAIYRGAHVGMFRRIVHADGVVVQLNTLFLLCIAFLPFSTSLSSNFDGRLAFIIYAGTLAAAGLLLFAISIYVNVRPDLVRPEHRIPAGGLIREAVPPLVFLLSIPLSFWDRDVANYSWLLIIPIGLLLNRFFPPRHDFMVATEPRSAERTTRKPAAVEDEEAHPS